MTRGCSTDEQANPKRVRVRGTSGASSSRKEKILQQFDISRHCSDIPMVNIWAQI